MEALCALSDLSSIADSFQLYQLFKLSVWVIEKFMLSVCSVIESWLTSSALSFTRPAGVGAL